MTPKLTAGRRLRTELDETLKRASEEAGLPAEQGLEWSEAEEAAIEAAVRAADRSAHLQELYDAEAAGDASPAVLVKISAEQRLVDRQVVDMLAKVTVEVGVAKSSRHQRAAKSRWDNRAARWSGRGA